MKSIEIKLAQLSEEMNRNGMPSVARQRKRARGTAKGTKSPTSFKSQINYWFDNGENKSWRANEKMKDCARERIERAWRKKRTAKLMSRRNACASRVFWSKTNKEKKIKLMNSRTVKISKWCAMRLNLSPGEIYFLFHIACSCCRCWCSCCCWLFISFGILWNGLVRRQDKAKIAITIFIDIGLLKQTEWIFESTRQEIKSTA